jgi:hypothetical protein
MYYELLTHNPLLLDEQHTSYNIGPPTTDIQIQQYANKHKYKYMYVCMHVCAL